MRHDSGPCGERCGRHRGPDLRSVINGEETPQVREPHTKAPDRGLFREHTLSCALQVKKQRVILATIHAQGKCSFHLADKTSTSTTSPANSMLAISENVACSGCACK